MSLWQSEGVDRLRKSSTQAVENLQLQFTSKGHIAKHHDPTILARTAPTRKSLPFNIVHEPEGAGKTEGTMSRHTLQVVQRQCSDDGAGTNTAFAKRFSFSLPSLDASRLKRPSSFFSKGGDGSPSKGSAAPGDIQEVLTHASPSGKKVIEKLEKSDHIYGNTGIQV